RRRGCSGGLRVLWGRAVAAVAAAAAAATVAAPSGFVGGAGLGGQSAFGTSRVALGAGRAFGAVFVAAAVAAGVARRAVGLRRVGAGFSAAMAVTVGRVTFAAAFLAIVAALAARTAALGLFGRGGRGRRGAAAQPIDQALEQAAKAAACRLGGRGVGGGRRDGRRLRRRNAFDQGFRARLDFGVARRPGHVGGRSLDELEAGLDIFQAGVVVAQAFDMVMRGFQVLVGNQHQVDLQARFHLGDVGALFVEQ